MIKKLINTVAAVAFFSFGTAYAATAFPTKPVTVIVPYGPGSGTDTVMRIIQPFLEKQLGVPLVIENRSGAGGAIGTKAIADSNNDGYTIGMSVVSTFASNRVFKQQPYDSLNDFSHLTRIGAMPRAMIVNKQFPTYNHKELLAELTREPEKYFYSTVINTVDMLNVEIYKSATGAKMTAVPYSDNNNTSRIDLKANRVQITFDSLPVLTPHVKTGDFKLVAITGTSRHPEYPGVPTFAELGIKDLTASSWYGFVAPKNLPQDRQAVLVKALHAALADPEVVAKISTLGIEVRTSTPIEHRNEIAATMELYSKVAARLGIVAKP